MKQYSCPKCGIALTSANASYTCTTKGGYCRSCNSEYHRKRYGATKHVKGMGTWEYKPCAKCGSRTKATICSKCVKASRPRKQPVATAPLYEPTEWLPPKRRLKMIEACRKRDGNRCAKCNDVMDDHSVTVDRIVPGAHGGKYELTNCQLMHVRCNASKSDHMPTATQTTSVAQMRFF